MSCHNVTGSDIRCRCVCRIRIDHIVVSVVVAECSDQSREICSSPELELLPRPASQVPPNITITSSALPENVEKLSAGGNSMMEVNVPKVITTPNFELKLVDRSVEKTRSNFQNILAWMEKNDSYFSSYKRTSLADLLETPEIANNQSSSFTKTLYAMKGFARDFAHLRIKSSYSYPEVIKAIKLGKINQRKNIFFSLS